MDNHVYLTAEKLEEFKKEYETLKHTTSKEVAVQIDDAKQQGDLSENAEYHEARNRMAFIQMRLAELEHLISEAVVIQEAAQKTTVQIGSVVEVKIADEKRTYTVVGSQDADPGKGLISNESPLGQAFIGHGVGDEVEVITPVKKTIYKITAIK